MGFLPNIELYDTPRPVIKHCPSKTPKAYMRGQSNIPLTRLVRKLLRHMLFNLQSLVMAYETRNEVLLSSCKVILLRNFGLAALTFLLLLP